jgi:hypothetical protein
LPKLPQILRKEQTEGFKNRELRRIFGPKMDVVTES